jgi:arginine decarboxylase
LDATLERHPEIELFVMTHPTYEGIASDMEAIVTVCRRHGVQLIVDEAHGSLYSLRDNLPQSAIQAGADAVVHSLHKSGGSLTQTALLHLPHESRLTPEAVQQALNLLQTTSPSYPLLANIEATCAWLSHPEVQEHIAGHQAAIRRVRFWASTHLANIDMLSHQGVSRDSFQVFLKSTKLTGEALAETLEEKYDIAFESATSHGVLLLMNLGLEPEAFWKLQDALLAIDADTLALPDVEYPTPVFTLPQTAMTPREAFFAQGQSLAKADVVGKISCQVVAACPPGIPILMPGEIITEDHLPYLPETVLATRANVPLPQSV